MLLGDTIWGGIFKLSNDGSGSSGLEIKSPSIMYSWFKKLELKFWLVEGVSPLESFPRADSMLSARLMENDDAERSGPPEGGSSFKFCCGSPV